MVKSPKHSMEDIPVDKGFGGGVPQSVNKNVDMPDKREASRYGKQPKSKKSNFRKV